MERSFSVVEDDESPTDFSEEKQGQKYGNLRKTSEKKGLQQMDDNDDDNYNISPKNRREISRNEADENARFLEALQKSSPGPSGRQTVLKSYPIKKRLSSESDMEESDDEEKARPPPNSGEYDPKLYENLIASPDAKEMFQYITKYIPQPMTLDYKFKPFVPEFLPAVGDIDAFLKVMPPTKMFSKTFETGLELGLVVLDEPTANQSDAALLHLQLRAESVNTTHNNDDVVVKKVDNVEKNSRTVDKWIKDISALHKSKSSPTVKYTDPMPDLDDLLQEWPEDVEKNVKILHISELTNGSLSDYVEHVCEVFSISSKNKIQALHLFFSLYAAMKSSQLFKTSLNAIEGKTSSENNKITGAADQLVLE